ncbi:MAG TPA: hypothetical protein VFI24_21790 [Pyrinomonadaceae bacterium]|nr:hypothetical protein [Pyrinomonadaceae bacterium]
MAEEKMFNLLDDVESTRLISAVYYAVRLIAHRDQLVNVYEGFKVENVESEPSSEDEALALSMISVIEQIEESKLQDIDRSSAEEYIFELNQIAQQRAADKFGYDAEKGRELLAQFEPGLSQQVGQNSN